MAKLHSANGEIIISTQNRDSLKVFKMTTLVSKRKIMALPTDSWAEWTYLNGKKERVELYYGSGYLSQSSRMMVIPNEVKSITMYDFLGKPRTVKVDD